MRPLPHDHSPNQITSTVHQALVQIYTFKQNGISLDDLQFDNQSFDADLSKVQLVQESEGIVDVIFPKGDSSLKQSVIDCLTQVEEDAIEAVEEIEEVDEVDDVEKVEAAAQEELSPLTENLDSEAIEPERQEDTEELETVDHGVPEDTRWLDVTFNDPQLKFYVSRMTS